MDQINKSAITAMAVIFMLAGVVLLIATLSDQEGLVQMFVWITFANVLFGLILVLSIAFTCMSKPKCLLDGMDWLSGACLLVFATGYLICWIYFISVANSYVVQAF